MESFLVVGQAGSLEGTGGSSAGHPAPWSSSPQLRKVWGNMSVNTVLAPGRLFCLGFAVCNKP